MLVMDKLLISVKFVELLIFSEIKTNRLYYCTNLKNGLYNTNPFEKAVRKKYFLSKRKIEINIQVFFYIFRNVYHFRHPM